MKTLLLIVAAAFGLASCEFKTGIEDYRDKGRTPFPSIIHFEYKGHDYIFFKTHSGHSATAGIVHDPECRCGQGKEDRP